MPTFKFIAQTELTSAFNVVDFTGIPNTYRDLVIICQTRSSNQSNPTQYFIRIQGDSSSNYYTQTMRTLNDATPIAQSSGAAPFWNYMVMQNANFDNYSGDFHYLASYTGTASRTVPIHTLSNCQAGQSTGRATYNSSGVFSTFTTNISQVTLQTSTGNFAAGSNFYLFGI